MKKSITEKEVESRRGYEELEEMVGLKAQEFIQEILEEEVEEFLARKKSERSGTNGDKWDVHKIIKKLLDSA